MKTSSVFADVLEKGKTLLNQSDKEWEGERKAEDLDEANAIYTAVKEKGWEEIQTGGGCTAYYKKNPINGDIKMITSHHGACVPETWNEAIIVGTYTEKEYNEIVLHLRFKENDARLQQETLGMLGTNLIYGAFYKYNEPRKLLRYLYDHLDKDQIEIDTINFSGPVFKDVDNRLMSLQLVKNGMTDAVMFSPDGNNVLPARVLYKKNILEQLQLKNY